MEARAIVEQADWPCQMPKDCSDVNLDCRRRVSSRLDWAFRAAEEATILEDDCIPHPSFLRLCDELLSQFWDAERVMHIAGAIFSQASPGLWA